MELNFNIFISHDSNDESVAVSLKQFLENIFLNASVYVSGRDLKGGQTWIENIKVNLRNSQVIVSLITTESINNNWLYFETGAGFVEDKSIPLLCDGVLFKDLLPPLSLLQARTLTKPGIEALVGDISNIVHLRAPQYLTGVDVLISESEIFFNLRKKENSMPREVAKVSPAAIIKTPSDKDAEIENAFIKTKDRAKQLTIRKIETFRDRADLPTKEEIEAMDLGMLQTLANAFNIKYPANAYISIFMYKIPKVDDPKWIKMNAQKQLDDANNALDNFEKTI